MERNSVRIGILGLMTPTLPYIVSGNLDIKVNNDPVRTARTISRKLKDQEDVDLVLALTHLGLESDKKLAENIEGIDVICGGHSHDIMDKAVLINRSGGKSTIVTQAGERGKYLGFLKLKLINVS